MTDQGRIDLEAAAEVKQWLRSCVLDPAVSTPLRALLLAYRMQDGRRPDNLVQYVIMRACPGLRNERVRGRVVVHGIAPRWTREALMRSIAS